MSSEERDQTLNQVVNGVMHAKQQQSVIGLIPGGTANVWANEIGMPNDPVQAALALIESEARKVDLGHIAVEGITLPDGSQEEPSQPGKKARKKHTQAVANVRQHFLLMAGLGIDAAVMGNVSQPLKDRVGVLAVGASAAREVPAHQPFPVEICAGDAGEAGIHWKGEALQVVIGNTRLYAESVQMTPDARIDDGVLDVCVITSGNPLTTIQQIFSLLVLHHPDNLTAEHFQGAHFSVSVPASVALQLDGSAVKLKKYLSAAEQQALTRVEDLTQVMVTYHFDAMPHAVQMAIPRTYHGALFDHSASSQAQPEEAEAAGETRPEDKQQEQETEQPSEQEQQENRAHVQGLLEQGRKVTVVGVRPDPAGKHASIIAGSIISQDTGEVQPVAVRIDAHTVLYKRNGEHSSLEALTLLRASHEFIVEGKKSKRGVIVAKQIVI